MSGVEDFLKFNHDHKPAGPGGGQFAGGSDGGGSGPGGKPWTGDGSPADQKGRMDRYNRMKAAGKTKSPKPPKGKMQAWLDHMRSIHAQKAAKDRANGTMLSPDTMPMWMPGSTSQKD